jgi:hypothetical protein
MKNKSSDLHNHLFAELERLGDEQLKGAELQEEISRANAISKIAYQIVANGDLVLRAKIAMEETLGYEKTGYNSVKLLVE